MTIPDKAEFTDKLKNLPLEEYADFLYDSLSHAVFEKESIMQCRTLRLKTIEEINQLISINIIMQDAITNGIQVRKNRIINERLLTAIYNEAKKVYISELDRFANFQDEFPMDDEIGPLVMEIVYEDVPPHEWQSDSEFYNIESLWRYKVLGKLSIANTYRYKDRDIAIDELKEHEIILQECLKEAKRIMTESEQAPLVAFVAIAIRHGLSPTYDTYRQLYRCLQMFRLIPEETQTSHAKSTASDTIPNYIKSMYTRAKKAGLL